MVRNPELRSELISLGIEAPPWSGPWSPGAWMALRGVLGQDWDRVHVHDARAQAAVRLLAPERLQLRLIVHRRVDDRARDRAWTRWKYARGHVVAVSQAAARGVEHLVAPDRVSIVHSGLPVPAVAVGPRPDPEEPFCILAVGALVPHKGHDLLLRALGRMPDETRLVIVGDGPLRRALEKLSWEMGLATRVAFAGHVPDPEVLFGRVDLFVHPSRSEGLGTAVIEAMAAGLPVLATDVGGLPELVIPGETGWLVRPDVEVLVDALLAAQTLWRGDHEEFRRLGLRGHARARERFQADRMVRATEDAVAHAFPDLISPSRLAEPPVFTTGASSPDLIE